MILSCRSAAELSSHSGRPRSCTSGPASFAFSHWHGWHPAMYLRIAARELSRALQLVSLSGIALHLILYLFLSFFKDRFKLVLAEGIEPTTPGVRVRYSNQLSYASVELTPQHPCLCPDTTGFVRPRTCIMPCSALWRLCVLRDSFWNRGSSPPRREAYPNICRERESNPRPRRCGTRS